jgi:NAD-dependent dihydropyrimidine dehydrogenase PreA subunit
LKPKVKIIVDQKKCDGCEECMLSCSGEVFEMKKGKAEPARVKDCVLCKTCEEICPKEAIKVIPEEETKNE